MSNINSMNNIDLKDKRVLIRLDLNVPIHNNKIVSDYRIKLSLNTIKLALNKKAKVIMIMSHLGRPKEGLYDKSFSLLPIVNYLKKEFLNHKIILINNYLNKDISKHQKENKIIVLENVRFNIGEKENNLELSKKYANLCDVFVMDAFGCAHRKQSSTYGICKFVKIVCAGPLLISEIKFLDKALKNPKRPMIAIVGGSKVSTKFNILKTLLTIADYVIVGGGIANTFLAVNNNVGNSLYEKNFVDTAKLLMSKFNVVIPSDCFVGNKFSEDTSKLYRKINNIQKNEMILDIGNNTVKNIINLIKIAKTILWNGPLGVCEFPNFRIGTEKIVQSIINSKAFSIAGGGDTLAIIDLLKIKNKISYVSTGGGAFLESIGGKKLPVIKAIEKYN